VGSHPPDVDPRHRAAAPGYERQSPQLNGAEFFLAVSPWIPALRTAEHPLTTAPTESYLVIIFLESFQSTALWERDHGILCRDRGADTQREKRGTAMTAVTLRKSLVGVVIAGALLALPVGAAAQVVQQTFDIQVVNPCTGNNIVEVTGLETTSISTKVSGSGNLHVTISDVFKGTGVDILDATKTYTYSDNEQFSSDVPIPVDPTVLGDITFTAKLYMKGSKALDNWTTKATVMFKVNSNGIVTKSSTTFSGDVCKG
jgi:hypothetical protein